MQTKRVRHTITKAPLIRPALAWLYHRRLNPSDIFIASYPRAGSTWLRFLLYELLTGNTTSFEAVDKAIPGIGRHFTAPKLVDENTRLIQTHEPFHKEYNDAIYLVRDVRDVVISEFYFQQLYQLFEGSFDEFLNSFLKGRVNRYGSWVKHTNSWLDNIERKSDSVLFIRFDDLRQNTLATVANILSFIGVEKSRKHIEQAIANNTTVKMRKKESSLNYTTNNVHFVRKGKIGGWREFLNTEQKKQIELYAGLTLRRLGYPLDTDESKHSSLQD